MGELSICIAGKKRRIIFHNVLRTGENLFDGDIGYSTNVYDLDAATKDGVIYPSLDPCIFEIKFPDNDIEGRVVGDI